MERRDLLKAAAALSAYGLPIEGLLAAKPVDEPGAPFDYAALKGRARSIAAQPFKENKIKFPEPIANLDFDKYQAIQFKPEGALWEEDKLGLQMRFFHLGFLFDHPVQLHEVREGRERALQYDPTLFNFGKSGVNGRKLSKNLGYAGFRLQHHSNPDGDVAAFLGASYFRAVGVEKQYGLSARGLAVDTGLPRPEEFPTFTHFWFEKPVKGSEHVVVYALLDSPSVAGAYRFDLMPGKNFVMDIDAALYPRKEIERLGIAPCTSMYQTGENDRRLAYDFRPEIHDSDGLAMWTGGGEWIWRPLVNPTSLRFNSFQDLNPRGFGLLQRDRNFENYQDDGVFYDRRPSLWVEPKGSWGAGAVELVEIPTVDETFDNIVAFWHPKEKPKPGVEYLFGYKLHWGAEPPAQPPSGIVRATRTGLGGVVGNKRKVFSWRFAVDFSGGLLSGIGREAKITAVVTASRGKIELTSARPLGSISGYRALFDLVPDASVEPINLKLYLAVDGVPLTESWFYQYTPPPVAERKLI